MKPPMMPKILNICPPAAIVDNTAFAFAEVDTKGFGFARFIFTMGATDIAMATVFQITHGDTSGSGHTSITAGVTVTAASATDDDKIWVIDVDLEGKCRYLDVTGTAGDGAAGTYLSATCELYHQDVRLNTAADAGLAEWVSA